MATIMEALWKQAISTFTSKVHRNGKVPHQENFEKLKALADRITASDVKLDTSLLSTHHDSTNADSHRRPPVMYIEIYEDKNITIGIFILRPGEKIPLHDHPNMYGILKVLSGTAKIQCYNLIPNESQCSNVFKSGDIFLAKKLPEIVVNETDIACVLTPVDRNLHEIECIGGSVAFLDILAPPYESNYLDVKNECHYFREVEMKKETCLVGQNVVQLENIPSPPNFWSKSAPYLGPPLRRCSEESSG